MSYLRLYAGEDDADFAKFLDFASRKAHTFAGLYHCFPFARWSSLTSLSAEAIAENRQKSLTMG